MTFTKYDFPARCSCAGVSRSLSLNGLVVAGVLLAGSCRPTAAQASTQETSTTEGGSVTRQYTSAERSLQEGTMVAEVDPVAAGVPVDGAVSASADAADSLPDAPGSGDPQTTQPAASGTPPQAGVKPSKRVLFIIPNYRSVAAGSTLPPQTVHQKFSTAVSDTIDPANFVLSALVAAYDYGRGATPEFHSGGVAFGRYYWHSLADQSVENFSVEFLVPALTHEDTRFYTLGRGSVGKRAEYALTRVLITRSDSGKETLNLGELLGAGLAAGASSRYYPASQRGAGSVLGSYGLDIGIDAASYVVREFDQDLLRAFSRKKR